MDINTYNNFKNKKILFIEDEDYAQMVKSLNNQLTQQKETTNNKDNLLKKANSKIIELEQRLTEKNKQIVDLHDVIESKNK